MPNGHRDPYRHDGGLNNPPSPAHSSDSDKTASQKQAYKIARAEVRARELELGRLLPEKARTRELFLRIAQFL